MRRTGALAIGLTLALALGAVRGAGPKFRADDPLMVEPETQDAAKAKPRDIDLVWDLSENLLSRPGDPAPDVRARNVNTIDEVPDSSWFTNRVLARPVSVEEIVRGPLDGPGPAPGPWLVTAPKSAGAAPGFRMRDSAGTTWFVSLDADGFPESASGALLVANKLFWALGYYQVENFLCALLARAGLTIAPTARIRAESGQRRPMRRDDLDAVLARAARAPDGSYRAIACPGVARHPARRLRVLRHPRRRSERRRAARASTRAARLEGLRRLDQPGRHEGRQHARHAGPRPRWAAASSATTCRMSAPPSAPAPTARATSTKAANRCSTGRASCCGSSRSASTCGPWQRVDYPEIPSIGRFEGRAFDPRAWSPRVPPAAVPALPRRRRVLGRPPGHGLHRRHDPGRRPHRGLQRSEGRGLPGRGAQRPARRHRAGLSAGDHPARRLRVRSRPRACRSPTWPSGRRSPTRRPTAIARSGWRWTTPPGAATPIGGEVRADTPLVPARRAAAGWRRRRAGGQGVGRRRAPPAWTAPVEVSFMRARHRVAPGGRRALAPGRPLSQAVRPRPSA